MSAEWNNYLAFGNAKSEKEALTLKYWGGRGLMEVPRVMLAIAGKFPDADYTDGRYGEPPAGLEANLGRMPVITVGTESIGQSVAINFYVAAENGLLGSNTLEAAQILGVAEHIKEMRIAYAGLVPYGSEPTPESEVWFDQGAMDFTGAADRTGQKTRYLTWWTGRIEASLGSSGFAVGNKLSLADVLLFNAYGEVLAADQAPEGFPAYRCEPFGNKAKTDAVLAKFPKVAACVKAVASNANVQKWLAMRGKQGF